jgi:hypothetical protein
VCVLFVCLFRPSLAVAKWISHLCELLVQSSLYVLMEELCVAQAVAMVIDLHVGQWNKSFYPRFILLCVWVGFY